MINYDSLLEPKYLPVYNRTCGECVCFLPCPCGCGYGWCGENGEWVESVWSDCEYGEPVDGGSYEPEPKDNYKELKENEII